MSMTTIPTSWRNCATCRHWTGKAIPNAFCSYVEVDTHETGKCMGGGYYMCNMYPLNSCRDYDARW